MRYILILLTVFVTGCSGQSNNDRQTKTDTAKLFNPNNHPDHSGAREINMFKRSVVLTHLDFSAILNESEHQFESLKKLSDFVKTNKIEIQKELFYIITDSNTAIKKIISTINVLTENQITDYKVINIQEYFKPPEPITIETPTSVVVRPVENDSTYLSITILNKDIDVNLSGQETKFKTTNELDSFIAVHRSDIKRIIIITTKDVIHVNFKLVLEVLKKHEFYKYNVVTK